MKEKVKGMCDLRREGEGGDCVRWGSRQGPGRDRKRWSTFRFRSDPLPRSAEDQGAPLVHENKKGQQKEEVERGNGVQGRERAPHSRYT